MEDDVALWNAVQASDLDTARAAFARFINAKPEEVAILSCASAGISAIASALDFNGSRRKVDMGEFEFPTMGQIWLAQQSRGAELRFIRSSREVIDAGDKAAAALFERYKRQRMPDHDFTPSQADELGLTWDRVHALNGDLVMINSVNGTLGDGAFNGWASVDISSKPLVKLDLDFQRLDVAMPKANGGSGPQPWSNAPFDLVGLPPTVEEVAAFEKEYAAGPEASYAALVERLLASLPEP